MVDGGWAISIVFCADVSSILNYRTFVRTHSWGAYGWRRRQCFCLGFRAGKQVWAAKVGRKVLRRPGSGCFVAPVFALAPAHLDFDDGNAIAQHDNSTPRSPPRPRRIAHALCWHR